MQSKEYMKNQKKRVRKTTRSRPRKSISCIRCKNICPVRDYPEHLKYCKYIKKDVEENGSGIDFFSGSNNCEQDEINYQGSEESSLASGVVEEKEDVSSVNEENYTPDLDVVQNMNLEEAYYDLPQTQHGQTVLNKSLKEFIAKNKRGDFKELLLFYTKGKPLSSTSKEFAPIERIKTNGGQILRRLIPGRIAARGSSVQLIHKRLLRMLSDPIREEITSKEIKVGPMKVFKSQNVLVYMKCQILFRRLSIMINSWLQDSIITRQYYVTEPILSQGVMGSYAQSSHFSRMYEYFKNRFPEHKILFVPLIVWSDGFNMRDNRLHHGSGHPILLSLANSVSGDIRVLGFLNINQERIGPKSALHDSLLSSQLMTKSLFYIFEELKEIQAAGGILTDVWGEQQYVLPYIAMYSGDLIELKKVYPSAHCPFCRSVSNDMTSPRFTQKEKEKVELIEKQQAKMRGMENVETNPRLLRRLEFHRVFYSKWEIQIKPVRSFAEKLDILALPVPDPLHTIALGEAKRAMRGFFEDLNLEQGEKLERKLKQIRLFPTAFLDTASSPTTVGTDWTRGCLLLILAFNEYPTPREWYVQIFNSLALVILGGSCGTISQKEKVFLLDAQEILNSLLNRHDITHALNQHILNESLWVEFGAIKNYSCGRFESSLKNIKRSLRAYNNKVQWHRTIMVRFICGEALGHAMDTCEKYCDPKIVPKLVKFVKLGGYRNGDFRFMEIGFIDSHRGYLFKEFQLTHISPYRSKSPGSRYSFIKFKTQDGSAYGKIIQISAPGLVNDCRFLLDEQECYIVVEIMQAKAQLPSGPHSAIFGLYQVIHGSQVQVPVDDILGCCYHSENKTAFWLSTIEIGHVLAPNAGPSEIRIQNGYYH
jgi:hypothetical protein